jgi:hypothetical protein
MTSLGGGAFASGSGGGAVLKATASTLIANRFRYAFSVVSSMNGVRKTTKTGTRSSSLRISKRSCVEN